MWTKALGSPTNSSSLKIRSHIESVLEVIGILYEKDPEYLNTTCSSTDDGLGTFHNIIYQAGEYAKHHCPELRREVIAGVLDKTCPFEVMVDLFPDEKFSADRAVEMLQGNSKPAHEWTPQEISVLTVGLISLVLLLISTLMTCYSFKYPRGRHPAGDDEAAVPKKSQINVQIEAAGLPPGPNPKDDHTTNDLPRPKSPFTPPKYQQKQTEPPQLQVQARNPRKLSEQSPTTLSTEQTPFPSISGASSTAPMAPQATNSRMSEARMNDWVNHTSWIQSQVTPGQTSPLPILGPIRSMKALASAAHESTMEMGVQASGKPAQACIRLKAE